MDKLNPSSSAKSFISLKDLRAHQAQVKQQYEYLEDNMISDAFSAQNLGLGFLTDALGSKGSSLLNLDTAKTAFDFIKSRRSKKKTSDTLIKKVSNTSHKSSTQKSSQTPSFVKGVAMSFVRWQLFNAAWWGATTLYKHCQEKQRSNKEVKKLQHEVKKLLK